MRALWRALSLHTCGQRLEEKQGRRRGQMEVCSVSELLLSASLSRPGHSQGAGQCAWEELTCCNLTMQAAHPYTPHDLLRCPPTFLSDHKVSR